MYIALGAVNFLLHRGTFLNWSNRRSIVQWYFPFKCYLLKAWTSSFFKLEGQKSQIITRVIFVEVAQPNKPVKAVRQGGDGRIWTEEDLLVNVFVLFKLLQLVRLVDAASLAHWPAFEAWKSDRIWSASSL